MLAARWIFAIAFLAGHFFLVVFALRRCFLTARFLPSGWSKPRDLPPELLYRFFFTVTFDFQPP
jgi:hypothetical protein